MRYSFILIVLGIMLLPSLGLCDGKFYWNEEVPPGIPYQRAAIMFNNDSEVLILQSKYELKKSDETDNIGWVVPLPAVPELASMDARVASRYFHMLDRTSSPDVKDISSMLFSFTGIFLVIAGAVMIIMSVLSMITPSRGEWRLRYLLIGLLMFIIGAVFLLPHLGTKKGVEVIKAEEVGIYDVKVVRSDSSNDLIEWLNGNGFKFNDSDKAVFDDYVGRGWCFVAAKVNPSRAEHEGEIVSEGLVAPLIMRFPTKKAIYPLALTAAAGQKTEILLYVLMNKKTTTNERLELWYAGRGRHGIGSWITDQVEPEGFFSDKELRLSYLCKFKGTLDPSEMSEDLEISFAGDDEEYRKHIVQW